jgi:hypothetical protein
MTGLAFIACTLALADPPAASAQPKPQAQGAHHTEVQMSPLRPKLEVVDQGVEDRGGLEKSFRVMPLDLRVPSGFQQVYRVPGSENLLMRGNGALFAVFPRSLYRRTVVGNLPVVPADVHYAIGMPGGFNYPGGSLDGQAAPIDPRIATRVDGRVRQGGETAATAPAEAVAPAAANAMPAISEAARARSSRDSAKPAVIETIEDLRLGPPVVTRE